MSFMRAAQAGHLRQTIQHPGSQRELDSARLELNELEAGEQQEQVDDRQRHARERVEGLRLDQLRADLARAQAVQAARQAEAIKQRLHMDVFVTPGMPGADVWRVESDVFARFGLTGAHMDSKLVVSSVRDTVRVGEVRGEDSVRLRFDHDYHRSEFQPNEPNGGMPKRSPYRRRKMQQSQKAV
jgi:hypothetical protein